MESVLLSKDVRINHSTAIYQSSPHQVCIIEAWEGPDLGLMRPDVTTTSKSGARDSWTRSVHHHGGRSPTVRVSGVLRFDETQKEASRRARSTNQPPVFWRKQGQKGRNQQIGPLWNMHNAQEPGNATRKDVGKQTPICPSSSSEVRSKKKD